MPLQQLIILYESEDACRAQLAQRGIMGQIADEIACYLAQATDLTALMERIQGAFAAADVHVYFFELDEAAQYLPMMMVSPATTMLWSMTDGFKYYRGSYATSAAALLGVKTFGSPPQAQHICQDKFKTVALARSLGIRVPHTTLLRNGEPLSPIFAQAGTDLFVKPNTLGAKIGIWADSRCRTFDEAMGLARRIWQRYGDEAVVQEFIAGYDVRVSFMNGGQPGERPHLGIYRLTDVEAGETRGQFMTMQDNWTLSASRGQGEEPIGSPNQKEIAFQPRMVDITDDAGTGQPMIDEIRASVWQMARLLGLKDYFSFDFRIGDDQTVYLLEFEVCPAVTIYDFQTYLRDSYGVDLATALRNAVSTSFHLA